MVLITYLRVLFLERLFTVQYLNAQVNWVVLSWMYTVVSLPCTISGSAVICLKESDMVVTQPGRTSRRLDMVISSVVISILLKMYVSEPEKQQIFIEILYIIHLNMSITNNIVNLMLIYENRNKLVHRKNRGLVQSKLVPPIFSSTKDATNGNRSVLRLK